ncbi:MAG TPA: ribonuclease HI family protein [Candidatus Saccharimonadales bacterium]|nr:ribonuclease HI family protein [Candidatus Saccharimonadales bacterium]
MNSEVHIYTDGGSRGNPGLAALGVYIIDTSGKKIAGFGKTLGVQTNNFAEYSAVIAAYEWLLKHRKTFAQSLTVRFFFDSQLVTRQLNGQYKIKNQAILQMVWKIKELQMKLSATVSYSHVPREQNKHADAYVNMALDGLL